METIFTQQSKSLPVIVDSTPAEAETTNF